MSARVLPHAPPSGNLPPGKAESTCLADITAMHKQGYHSARYDPICWITETANDDRPEPSGDIR
jgi:hypothetical protein